MPCGGPNLGKTACVIFVMLCYALRSSCNMLFPLPNHKGADGPIGGRGFPRHLWHAR